MKIGDLAELFSERSGKPINIIGLRPGEKTHEDLLNESESSRTRQEGSHYVIDPAFKSGSGERFTYSSAEDVMSKEELHKHLTKLGVIDWSLDRFIGATIEEFASHRGT
jgi:FlaA1/EpsC-like NDP-sugar epimerase